MAALLCTLTQGEIPDEGRHHKALVAHLELPGTSVARCMKLADLGSWGGRPVTDATSTGSSLICEGACNPGELLLLDTAASMGLAGTESCREVASLWRPHLEASGGLPPRMDPRSFLLTWARRPIMCPPAAWAWRRPQHWQVCPGRTMLAAHSSSASGRQSGCHAGPQAVTCADLRTGGSAACEAPKAFAATLEWHSSATFSAVGDMRLAGDRSWPTHRS